MYWFIINLNSEMKEESCEAILAPSLFAVTLGRMFSVMLEWGGCEVKTEKEDLSFVLSGTKLILSSETSLFLRIEL